MHTDNKLSHFQMLTVFTENKLKLRFCLQGSIHSVWKKNSNRFKCTSTFTCTLNLSKRMYSWRSADLGVFGVEVVTSSLGLGGVRTHLSTCWTELGLHSSWHQVTIMVNVLSFFYTHWWRSLWGCLWTIMAWWLLGSPTRFPQTARGAAGMQLRPACEQLCCHPSCHCLYSTSDFHNSSKSCSL